MSTFTQVTTNLTSFTTQSPGDNSTNPAMLSGPISNISTTGFMCYSFVNNSTSQAVWLHYAANAEL